MKQILQSLASGETLVAEVPCPAPGPGALLVASTVSLISAGTERMLVDFGRGSYLAKARQQPDKVRQVLEKARTDGVASTLEAISSKNSTVTRAGASRYSCATSWSATLRPCDS